MKKKYLLLPISIFFLLVCIAHVQASNFDPNHIISDQDYLDNTSMSLAEIQLFLESKGSYLAKYSCPNAFGVMKKASEIIYDAAVNNYDCGSLSPFGMSEAEKQQKCTKITINPKLLLVLLQKEQSLIEDGTPRQSQLDWAVGYGCPDNQDCNTRWLGFGKQVNSAALQFVDYINNTDHYTFKAGQTYTVTNTNKPSMVVTPVNRATAALYNYTPHVYNGNYNFHKLWLRYFTFSYTNGALLQAKGEAGVWLVQNGQKRAFLTRGALTSRFDMNKVIQVSKADLDRYTTGAPIKFSQYSLVKTPENNIFLLVDDKKRPIVSYDAFRKIGFNPEEIVNVSWKDLEGYEDGPSITSTTTYPTGALLQDKTTGGVFWVTEGTKAPIWDRVLLKTKFKFRSITPTTPAKLASYETVQPAIFGDGELIKADKSQGVYVIDNMRKRVFISGELFEKLGYKWNNIITVPKKILDLYPDGLPIKEASTEIEDAATSTPEGIASSTPDNISSSTPGTASTSNPDLSQELDDILNPGQ